MTSARSARLLRSVLAREELGESRGRAPLEQERLLPTGDLDPAPQACFSRERVSVVGEMQ